MTDQKLIANILYKDTISGKILFDRYHKRVYSFYRYMGLSTQDAEDLTQEVFESVFRSINSFKTSRPFKPWLYQIMRNKLVDFRRTTNKTVYLDINDYDFKQINTSKSKDGDLIRLNKALLELNSHDRELILLIKFQQLSYAEVSTMLSISEGALKTRVHRIIKKLKEYFKKHYPHERD